jgi:hypothetical protein
MTGIVVKSYIKYFAVPKGDNDVQMVYNAMANNLNERVWVPTFWLPMINLLVRAVDRGSWMTDGDMGDMFLNYQLHGDVRPFTAVDLSYLYEDPGGGGPRWAVWDRNLMGFAALPYNSIKMALVAEEVCKGDRFQVGLRLDGKELNPFQWKSIQLNLPGTSSYDPSTTWILKRREDGQIACNVFTFVDDKRVVGPTKELTWQTSHALASKQSYLVIQDTVRKARPCSQTMGAGAGAIMHILDKLGVCVLTSREKWLKMQGILKKWRLALAVPDAKLSPKELLSDRGFLVYVMQTYPTMVPHGGQDDLILSAIQAKSSSKSGHQRNSCQILQNRATESCRACAGLVPKLLLQIPLYMDFSILIPLCRMSMSIIASSAYLLGP